MRVFTVDLYDYFKVEKPDGARAELRCYLLDNSKEINSNRKSPAMLVLPGGGYGFVSDREAEPVAIKFLSRGFSSFVLTYSIAPIRFPYQLVEAVMAINYIRLNAEELAIDPDMVASVGFSAGGHLCATLGTIADCDEVQSIFKSRVCPKPNAIILGYPVITADSKRGHLGSFVNLLGKENQKDFDKLDVYNLVDKNSSPAFIWSTVTDATVPVKNALLVASAYEREGLPFALHIWGRGDHGLSVADKTVYGKIEDSYPILDKATCSVHKWLDLAVEWLEEIGIAIKD